MRYITYFGLLIIVFSLITNSVQAQDKLTADQIMKKVDIRIIPKDLTAEMKMNLIDSKDQIRSRSLKSDRIGDDKQIMWFLQPADVKGSSFLRISYDNRDDDMWLYLPAFGKVRRIASHAKKGNFMGTDLTYEDMGDRKLKDYTYKLIKEESIDNKPCWVIESTPQKGVDTDYSKINSWIWKDAYFQIKEEFYDTKGTLKKVKTTELVKAKTYWVPKRMTMDDLKAKHKTEMVFEKIEVDTDLDPKIFDSNNMTKIY